MTTKTEEKEKEQQNASVFSVLNNVDVTGHTEKKNNLTYLSWAWAWTEVKKRYPDATYTIYERDGQYGPVNYFTDGRTSWVKTGVTINGLEHIEELPVMDFRNASIPLEKMTSFDVNKAIQRSLTKACARHGLGLFIYAGEDLPEAVAEQQAEERRQAEEEKLHKSLAEARDLATQVASRKDFQTWWAKYPALQHNEAFIDIAQELAKKFPKTA